MDMGYGLIKWKLKYSQGATEWIKNKVLEFMSGLENKLIKVSLEKIIVKALVDSTN